MWTEKDAASSCNFIAPAGLVAGSKNEVLFPLTEKKSPDFAAVIPIAVKQMKTIVAPAQLTGNAKIDLAIDAQVTPGAMLHLKLTPDATNRTVTLGNGFDNSLASVLVTASKPACISFMYDGASFLPMWNVPV